MTDATYIHGTGSAEQARLTELNEVLNARCLRELALSMGDRVLDVGCGLAQLTRAMGRTTGRQVVGVERSQSQISEALRQARAASEEHLIELRQGDATALPLAPSEARAFDVAHARFILEHVADPLAVVRQMARAVRDGGRLVLADDDHSLVRLHPEPPHFGPTWDAFVRSYHRLGNDPFVGRRLPALLHAAGVTPTRITWVFFGACAGEAAFPALVENLAGNIRGARTLVTAVGTVTESEVDLALESLAHWAKRPDAAIWYGMNWAEGRRDASRAQALSGL